MAYASKAGLARTNPKSPQAFGICDRCGFTYNHVNLHWQYDWRGASLQNLRILVCDECTDSPQQQLRAIVLPADPIPIMYPRPEDFVGAEAGSATGEPYGQPTGLLQGAVMPLFGTTAYNVALPVLSISSTGTNVISVTCSSPHGLSTNAQISVEGLTQAAATGFYSVTVTTGTAFTYTTLAAIPSGSLLTNTTRMVTANVGLPYGYTQIPQVV